VARQIPGVGGGKDYALWGYSQGGHAALFAADLSDRYAPELQLKGVAAVAPPTDLATLMRADLGSVAGRILASFTLASWNKKYGAPLEPLVDKNASAVIAEVGRSCVDDIGGQLDALAAQKSLVQNFLKADPTRLPPWSGLLVENSKFSLSAKVPALIIQGDSDDLVRPAVTTAFVRASCRSGNPVQYTVLKGKGHGASIAAAAHDAVNWLAARLNGKATRGNCR
jgi:pimeloyl-ACP methyl ester carboxylesterase